MAETRGAKTKLEVVGLQYCGGIAHMHIFSPKDFATSILILIAIFQLEFFTTRILIYFSTMTEMGSAETQMGAASFQYWLIGAYVDIIPPKDFATTILVRIAILFHHIFWITRKLI